MTIKVDDVRWYKGCGFTRTVMDSKDWTIFYNRYNMIKIKVPQWYEGNNTYLTASSSAGVSFSSAKY